MGIFLTHLLDRAERRVGGRGGGWKEGGGGRGRGGGGGVPELYSELSNTEPVCY